ncbi:hypothetical protein PAEPH01_1437 [Pancytospora epiphaga]|nr:hypothetical protein PAEPH01_1437 [Pancytospora epiphaga]
MLVKVIAFTFSQLGSVPQAASFEQQQPFTASTMRRLQCCDRRKTHKQTWCNLYHKCSHSFEERRNRHKKCVMGKSKREPYTFNTLSIQDPSNSTEVKLETSIYASSVPCNTYKLSPPPGLSAFIDTYADTSLVFFSH